MKKLLSFLVLSLLMSSCGSGPAPKKGEFDWVKNEDFKPKQEIKFNIHDDFYTSDIIERDSLGKETIAKLPLGQLKKITNSKDYLIRGTSLCYRGKYALGLAELKKVYFSYKNNSSYWNQMGTCFLLQGNKRKALLFYNKSRSLNKKFAPPHNNLGVIYQKSNLDQKALVAYKGAKKINTFALTPNFNMSQLYLKYGFVNRAERGFNALFKHNSLDLDVVNGLAFILMSNGRYQDAKALYERIPADLLEKASYGINYAVVLRFLNLNEDARSVIENINQATLGEYASYYNDVTKFIGK